MIDFICFASLLIYMFPYLNFSVVRSSLKVANQLFWMKETVKQSGGNRDDFITRTASLTLQTCILNIMSQFATGFATLLSTSTMLFIMAQRYEAAALTWRFLFTIVFYPQAAVVICSSNFGFILYCNNSTLYREAKRETFAEMKASFKAKFRRLMPNTTNKVLPTK